MNPEFLSMMERLDQQVRAMAAAQSPSEAFKILLEASRLASPRTAVFLVRQGQFRGWGSVGYAVEIAQRQRAFACAVEQSGLEHLLSDPPIPFAQHHAGSPELDFGQPPAAEGAAMLVRVKDKAIALLLLERGAGEAPWAPHALAMLVSVAQLRLDLDLAQRKLQTGAQPHAALSPEVAAVQAAVNPVPPVESIEPPETPALAPAASVSEADAPRLDAARRFARLVATDIRLYNEQAVALGRRNGDLAQRLGEHLNRGRDTFLRRHGDLGPTALEILHEAYVNVLAAGDSGLLPAALLHGG